MIETTSPPRVSLTGIAADAGGDAVPSGAVLCRDHRPAADGAMSGASADPGGEALAYGDAPILTVALVALYASPERFPAPRALNSTYPRALRQSRAIETLT